MRGPIQSIRYIHKAIKRHAGQLEDGLFDELDAAGARALAERAQLLARVVHVHTQSEEIGLFPALEERVPHVAQTYLMDHSEEERHFAHLLDGLGALPDLPAGSERDALIGELRRLAGVLTEHVHLHIQKEHKHILPLIEDKFTPDEQGAMVGKMVGSIPPADLQRAIPWIFEALNTEDRADYLTSMKRGMPPERFAVVVGWVKGALSADDWADVVREAPELD